MSGHDILDLTIDEDEPARQQDDAKCFTSDFDFEVVDLVDTEEVSTAVLFDTSLFLERTFLPPRRSAKKKSGVSCISTSACQGKVSNEGQTKPKKKVTAPTPAMTTHGKPPFTPTASTASSSLTSKEKPCLMGQTSNRRGTSKVPWASTLCEKASEDIRTKRKNSDVASKGDFGTARKRGDSGTLFSSNSQRAASHNDKFRMNGNALTSSSSGLVSVFQKRRNVNEGKIGGFTSNLPTKSIQRRKFAVGVAPLKQGHAEKYVPLKRKSSEPFKDSAKRAKTRREQQTRSNSTRNLCVGAFESKNTHERDTMLKNNLQAPPQFESQKRTLKTNSRSDYGKGSRADHHIAKMLAPALRLTEKLAEDADAQQANKEKRPRPNEVTLSLKASNPELATRNQENGENNEKWRMGSVIRGHPHGRADGDSARQDRWQPMQRNLNEDAPVDFHKNRRQTKKRNRPRSHSKLDHSIPDQRQHADQCFRRETNHRTWRHEPYQHPNQAYGPHLQRHYEQDSEQSPCVYRQHHRDPRRGFDKSRIYGEEQWVHRREYQRKLPRQMHHEPFRDAGSTLPYDRPCSNARQQPDQQHVHPHDGRTYLRPFVEDAEGHFRLEETYQSPRSDPSQVHYPLPTHCSEMHSNAGCPSDIIRQEVERILTGSRLTSDGELRLADKTETNWKERVESKPTRSTTSGQNCAVNASPSGVNKNQGGLDSSTIHGTETSSEILQAAFIQNGSRSLMDAIEALPPAEVKSRLVLALAKSTDRGTSIQGETADIETGVASIKVAAENEHLGLEMVATEEDNSSYDSMEDYETEEIGGRLNRYQFGTLAVSEESKSEVADNMVQSGSPSHPVLESTTEVKIERHETTTQEDSDERVTDIGSQPACPSRMNPGSNATTKVKIERTGTPADGEWEERVTDMGSQPASPSRMNPGSNATTKVKIENPGTPTDGEWEEMWTDIGSQPACTSRMNPGSNATTKVKMEHPGTPTDGEWEERVTVSKSNRHRPAEESLKMVQTFEVDKSAKYGDARKVSLGNPSDLARPEILGDANGVNEALKSLGLDFDLGLGDYHGSKSNVRTFARMTHLDELIDGEGRPGSESQSGTSHQVEQDEDAQVKKEQTQSIGLVRRTETKDRSCDLDVDNVCEDVRAIGVELIDPLDEERAGDNIVDPSSIVSEEHSNDGVILNEQSVHVEQNQQVEAVQVIIFHDGELEQRNSAGPGPRNRADEVDVRDETAEIDANLGRGGNTTAEARVAAEDKIDSTESEKRGVPDSETIKEVPPKRPKFRPRRMRTNKTARKAVRPVPAVTQRNADLARERKQEKPAEAAKEPTRQEVVTDSEVLAKDKTGKTPEELSTEKAGKASQELAKEETRKAPEELKHGKAIETSNEPLRSQPNFVIIDDSSGDEDDDDDHYVILGRTRKLKHRAPRPGITRKGFDFDKHYNARFTAEAAQAMQERLFQEAASRVRSRSFEVSVEEETRFCGFSKVVIDIHRVHPLHWSWKDPWACLGLPPNSESRLVKAQYRRLAKLYHPDKSKHKGTIPKFHAIAAAYKKVCAMRGI